MKISIYANRITVGIGNPDPPPPPTRGIIRGFSPASRKRLLDIINSARNMNNSLFVTVTYPDHFPRHPKVWKTHIANLRKRLARQYPNVGGVWRLELKKRKSGANTGKVAPHFHLILRGVTGSLKRTRHWVSVAWYEIVKSGDKKHLAAGTNVELCENRNHAAWYVAKYIAKLDQNAYYDATTGESLWTGRMWGRFGHFYTEEFMKGEISHSRYKFFRSIISGWLKEDGNEGFAEKIRGSEYGFTIYGYGPEGDRWPQLAKLLQHCEIHEDADDEIKRPNILRASKRSDSPLEGKTERREASQLPLF